MTRGKLARRRTTAAATVAALLMTGATMAFAAGEEPIDYVDDYTGAAGTIWAPTAAELATANKANSVLYPKAAQLPSGRLVAAFERSFGDPVGQTMPLYKSDDYGNTWQKLGDLPSPADATAGTPRAAQFAKWTSNWTNPYLYTLTENVGDLSAGTLLLASVVSGDDPYFKEQRAANPNWMPTRDGDRKDVAIALYASTDGVGESWELLNIIVEGGWEGSYGALFATENTYQQVDPVWEPYLMVYEGQLVAYYSDENEYSGYDAHTGVLTLDPANDTAHDPVAQILAHKTWDGLSSSTWSEPVLDVADRVAGSASSGRPGMTTVVPTTDGKWLLTYEQGKARLSDDPLRFWDAPNVTLRDTNGTAFHTAGSPVLITIPNADGTWRIAFNNDQGSNGGDIFVNESGSSTGAWTRYRTPVAQGYSRNLTYVPQTGRIVVLRGSWGGSPITHGQVDVGNSVGAYYQLVNRKTGLVLGTGGASQDGDRSGKRVYTETAGSATNPDTQYWHLVSRGAEVTLLNKSGGRALGIWQNNTAAGGVLAQWVDDGGADKLWTLVATGDGYYRLRPKGNAQLYATGGAEGATVTNQLAATDGSQDWQLVTLATADPAPTAEVTATTRCVAGKIAVAVSVKNTDSRSIDATIGSAYGNKQLGALAPGTTTSTAFTVRSATMPAGEVSVTLTADGTEAVLTAAVPATTCG
ncbi:MAG TPA: RICIN domain-containing protein [Arachnia sp.]|nr:RICIN domain-containing protein [Arachnia sp.]HMT85605.1 RICIN domain-containing protein [Arachnia sp.]